MIEAFGHLEGDTIIGRYHKSALIHLVERKAKSIIALKPNGSQAAHIESSLYSWLNQLLRNLLKSITFDCGKEFYHWKSISHKQGIAIYFVDSGTPSQHGLMNILMANLEETDFNPVSQAYILKVARKRNNIL